MPSRAGAASSRGAPRAQRRVPRRVVPLPDAPFFLAPEADVDIRPHVDAVRNAGAPRPHRRAFAPHLRSRESTPPA
ncbi:hypothetical protein OsI_11651 [Oryza sativa Indica Group]|uniref:Uncharacterized protein n=2 Tax=Oryza TaxID=4527 RepID=A0A0E0GML5_ORYNI|nr:hypothetical protein OsI_11651 [Oryza sativa Indica Group]